MIKREAAQAAVERILSITHAPSISVTIYDNGEIFSVNAGLSNIENDIPASENTMYELASGTKSFGAASIAALCADNKLSLDDPVKKYIPEIQLYNDYVTANLTIRDMLCHRSGLPRHDNVWSVGSGQCTVNDILSRLPYLEPTAPFRSQWQYQNIMYILTGEVVKRVSGQKWEDFVKQRILEPLGMDPVNFSVDDMARYPKTAQGYTYDHETARNIPVPYKKVDILGPAGSINTTTAQAIKWVAFHINGNDQIIPQQLMRECHRPHVPYGEETEYTRFRAYGLGWVTESYRGRKLVWHNGCLDGFSSMMGFLPQYGFGMAILINQTSSTARAAVMRTLIDLYFGDEPVDWATQLVQEQEEEYRKEREKERRQLDGVPENAPASFALKDAVGTYENPAYGTIKIDMCDGALCAWWNGQKLRCEHIAYNYYQRSWMNSAEKVPLYFRTDMKNRVVALHTVVEPVLKKGAVFMRTEKS